MIDIHRVTTLYISEQFARFMLVGAVAALLHWLSRFAFNVFTSYALAIVLAYLVGIAVAFMLNKIYVFPFSKRPLNFEISFFLFVNIAAFPVVWIVAYILGEKILPAWLPIQIALALGHGFAIILPAFVNFALHKFITFRGA